MAENNQDQSPKEALVSFIVSNFYRFINNPNTADERGLMMLVAALGLINTSDSTQAQNAARRLAQAALSKKSINK